MKVKNFIWSQWTLLTLKPQELLLEKTLFSGQAFRWKRLSKQHLKDSEIVKQGGSEIKVESLAAEIKVESLAAEAKHHAYDGHDLHVGNNDAVFGCVLYNTFVALTQSSTNGSVYYKCFYNPKSTRQEDAIKQARDLLNGYFQLDTNLADLWSHWSKDPNFKRTCTHLQGLRVLKQPQVENIFSFICSSNNNIKRISGMVQNLALKYGTLIGHERVWTAGNEDDQELPFHAFPTLKQLVKHQDTLEEELRVLGFGYRAKYIVKTALYLDEQDPEYLTSLLDMPYPECRLELLKLSGVGPKVADCIALFSCNKTQVIPVDTHVWQIATRDYKLNVKTLNNKTYTQVVELFQKVFGEYAGWAHSVLFTADLSPSSDQQEVAGPALKKRKTKVKSENDDFEE